MSKQTAVPAGDRFANDLRRIREAQGVTIKEIHEETRVARSLVQTFERGDLYDHPGFNRVYMRSFIRAYTSCLGVDAEEALGALDDALDGTYEHDLADRYLEEDETESEGGPEEERQDESGTSSASDLDETGSSGPNPDSGQDRAADAGPPQSRHGRPMGGRAAAGSDLSSVSAPRPVGGGTNGSAESASDAGETEASTVREETKDKTTSNEGSDGKNVSRPAGSSASAQSAEDGSSHEESAPDEAPASAEPGPGAEQNADGAEADPNRTSDAESAIDERTVGDQATAVDEEGLVGDPSPASPPADASEDDARKEADADVSAPADAEDDAGSVSPAADSEEDADEENAEEEDDSLHPLMRDPSDLDVDEEEKPEGPPDLQPHEDPSSDIAPDAEDLPDDDVPSWMQSGSGEASKGKQTQEREGGAEASADAADATDADTHTVSAGTIDDTAPLPDRSSADRATETPSVLRTLLRQQTLAVGIGAVVSLLLAGVLLFWGLGGFSESSESGSASGETPAALSAGAGSEASGDTMEASSADRPPPADVTLGETLHLTIVAETDIGGLRIQRDDDLRRPYWIEAGEAAVFPFERRVIVSDPGEDIDRILVEGYPYPADRTDAQGRLVLTRDSIQSFADTLRGAPDEVAAPSDTIAIPPTAPESESDGASEEEADAGSSLP